MKIQLILVIAALFVCGVFAVGDDHLPKEKRSEIVWTYEGQDSWPDTCATGKFQSPININTYKAKKHDLFRLPWKPHAESGAKVYKSHGTTTTALFETPHADALDFDTTFLDKYSLIQVHYHTPSEHRVNGQQYPLELHFVHKNHHGALSVIGVFFKEGKKNKNLYQLINKDGFPEEEGATNKTFHLGSIIKRVDLENYWTYSGSLTTPPCTEGVRWFVLKKVLTASEGQIEALQEAYGNTARKPQVLNTRTVWARERKEHDEYDSHKDEHKHRPQHDDDYDEKPKSKPKPQHDDDYEEEKPRPRPNNDYDREDKPRPKPQHEEENDWDKKRTAPKILGKN